MRAWCLILSGIVNSEQCVHSNYMLGEVTLFLILHAGFKMQLGTGCFYIYS